MIREGKWGGNRPAGRIRGSGRKAKGEKKETGGLAQKAVMFGSKEAGSKGIGPREKDNEKGGGTE